MSLVLADRNYKPHTDFRSIRWSTYKKYERGIVHV